MGERPPDPLVLRPEELFERLSRYLPGLLCIADVADGRFRWLSPNWEQVLGWSRGELVGRRFLELVHPDDVQATLHEMTSIRDGAHSQRFENRYQTKDGGWIWLQWNSIAARPGDVMTYAIAREITAEKTLELLALERSRLLELAAETAGLGYWSFPLPSGLPTWSRETYSIHGFDPGGPQPSLEQAVACYHPEDREEVQRAIAAAIERQEPFDFELRLIRADGEIRDVVAKGRVQLNHNGTPNSVFGTLQDVTELRAQARQLQQSESLVALGTLAAGVAHEINNPLTYVLGHLEQLRGELEQPELAELARLAYQGAEHVKEIVAKLRALSPGRETVTEADEPIRLAEVLETGAELSEHQVRHRAEFIRELAEDLPWVVGDRTTLIQVVVNLLLNAARVLPEGRPENRIVLRAWREQDRARIEVEDNGPGIPLELQQRVFDPFFTTRAGEGTGLGLAISHNTVARHGGRLTLESAPGRTVFRIELPTGEPPAPAPERATTAPKPEPEERPTATRALVVDDDALVAQLIAMSLEAHGFVVEQVESGDQALELLAKSPFDVVVCDLMMPGMSGWELHDVLERDYPEMARRSIFVTGGAFSDAADRFLDKLPPQQVLEKPFLPRDLIERIELMLSE